MSDGDLRRRLGAAGAGAAARFGLERFSAEVREIFDELLADYTGGFAAEIERLRDEL